MILVFAGAGASKAVDPSGYPTTQEFFERLPKSISGDPVFVSLVQFVQSKIAKAREVDIEEWLWAATEARDVLNALSSSDHPAGYFFKENRINAALGIGIDINAAAGVGSMIVQRLNSLEERVNRLIYDFYAKRPTRVALEQTWIPLLQSLSEQNVHVEVFTTNYDVVLEEAIKLGGIAIDTGRRTGVFAELEEGAWLNEETSTVERRGLLTKLHGSVDWSRVNEQVYFGTPKFQGVHEDQVIIYPGFKGVPDKRPFTLFHEHFSRSVERASAALFIGFAFRDQYINQVLRDRLSAEARVIVLNPAQRLPSLPFRREQLIHIHSPFNRKSVDAMLQALGAAVPILADRRNHDRAQAF